MLSIVLKKNVFVRGIYHTVCYKLYVLECKFDSQYKLKPKMSLIKISPKDTNRVAFSHFLEVLSNSGYFV